MTDEQSAPEARADNPDTGATMTVHEAIAAARGAKSAADRGKALDQIEECIEESEAKFKVLALAFQMKIDMDTDRIRRDPNRLGVNSFRGR